MLAAQGTLSAKRTSASRSLWMEKDKMGPFHFSHSATCSRWLLAGWAGTARSRSCKKHSNHPVWASDARGMPGSRKSNTQESVGMVSAVRWPHSGQVMIDCKMGCRAGTLQLGCSGVPQSRERANKRFQTRRASRTNRHKARSGRTCRRKTMRERRRSRRRARTARGCRFAERPALSRTRRAAQSPARHKVRSPRTFQARRARQQQWRRRRAGSSTGQRSRRTERRRSRCRQEKSEDVSWL